MSDDFQWPDAALMSEAELRLEVTECRARFEVLERDLAKQMAEARKLKAQVKQLQDLQSAQGLASNNTSSAFTLPSEFKKLWDQLLTEQILDAFPDFLGDFRRMTVLTQQLFKDVRALIIDTKRLKLEQLSAVLFGASETSPELEQRLQTVFKDQAQAIFKFSDDQLSRFIQDKYRLSCLPQFSDCALLDEAIATPDFAAFTRAVVQLQLHMVLSDPPVELQLQATVEADNEQDRYEFWMYNKNDYYCIDGFPKEGLPCVVVMPPPYRQGFVYQGIKPAVIVLSGKDCTDELKDHVRVKQERLLDKIKQKRANSLAPPVEEPKAIVELTLPSAIYSTKKVALETEFTAPPSGQKSPASDRSLERDISCKTFDSAYLRKSM